MLSGFETRQWTDLGSDTAPTTTQVSDCSRGDQADFTLDVELWKYRWYAPNVSCGRKDVSSCKGGAPVVDWGNPGEGDFYDKFWHQDYGTVSAGSVKIRY